MIAILRGARSLLSVLLVGFLFALMSPVLRLLVIPGSWLFPGQRVRLVSWFMKAMSASISGLLALGGARFRRLGRIPTAPPVLVVANHQSLLDITQITLMSRPWVPAFVTRSRYSRFVPLVSASVRLLHSPIVDPRRDPKAALEAIRAGARTLPNGMVIFPEGHRSTDGEIRPFRTSGLEAILRERRLPVFLVVNDGVWPVRRLSDLLFRVHLIDAVSQVIGPLEPPADETELRAFADELRGRLVAGLAELRRGPRTS